MRIWKWIINLSVTDLKYLKRSFDKFFNRNKYVTNEIYIQITKKVDQNGCCKFYPLRRKYLSSAVNVLTNSPKTSDIPKRDIFSSIFVRRIKKSDQSAVMQISAAFERL